VNQSLAKFIAEKAALLESAGIEQGGAEVELILCHLLGVGRLELVLHGMEKMTPDLLAQFDDIIAQRTRRFPLQFILGESWFYGRKFKVTPAVMAPTPETELLCEAAIGFAAKNRLKSPRLLDIGTGSGVIALTVASEIPGASVVALDVSSDALEVAKENAATFGLSQRVEFRLSDLFSSIQTDEQFDLILSNPPYIAEPDYAGLPPEVLADPKVAMTSGPEGLDIIRMILGEAPKYLKPSGRIMFEIGYDQANRVAALTGDDSRYHSISILRDLNDIDRVVILGCD
jgi:release factor glutamine methyltransferase